MGLDGLRVAAGGMNQINSTLDARTGTSVSPRDRAPDLG
jgi:hypothetical protein